MGGTDLVDYVTKIDENASSGRVEATLMKRTMDLRGEYARSLVAEWGPSLLWRKGWTAERLVKCAFDAAELVWAAAEQRGWVADLDREEDSDVVPLRIATGERKTD